VKPGAFLSRRSQVAVCLEGTNAILFNADSGAEKVVNHSGFAVWRAMDGRVRSGDLAKVLAAKYEVPLTTEVRSDAAAFADELVREGYASASELPGSAAEEVLDYPSIGDSPKDFELALTGRCNLRCAYCFYADEMVGRADLPTQSWLTFFEHLRSLAVRNLTLSGGELFLRKDLWTLLDGIVDGRMRYSLNTNGTLITEETVDRLLQDARRRRLNIVQVSIDGSCAEIHDRSRGKGSFAGALRGLRLLKAAGLPVTARVTVNRHNVDDLEGTARLLLDEIGLNSFGTNDAMPMGTGCERQESIIITPAQRLTAMTTLARLDRMYPGRINASAGSLGLFRMYREMEGARATGTSTSRWRMGVLSSCGCMHLKLAVHHDGTVVPCNMLAAASLGNIREHSIRDIWRAHPLLEELRGRKNLPMADVRGCEACEWTPYCNGGCPAVEYTRTGDLYRVDPNCCYRRFIAETGGLPALQSSR